MASPKVLCDVISLLCDTSEEETVIHIVDRKSVAHRSLEYLLSLNLHALCSRLLTESEKSLLQSILNLCEAIPSTVGILSRFLSRKWPKWHSIDILSDMDVFTIESMIDMGLILDLKPANISSCVSYPNLDPKSDLLQNIEFLTDKKMIDILLESLPIDLLRDLSIGNTKCSRKSLVIRVKNEFNGTQGTIFGGPKNIEKMISQINQSGVKYFYLSESVRNLFVTISFMLDIDSDDEYCWNNALPSTLLKSYAKLTGSLSLKILEFRKKLPNDTKLYVYQTRSDLEVNRILQYLATGGFDRETILRNTRFFLDKIACNSPLKPSWWWRRQLPRRCANLLWTCIAELEREKKIQLAVNTLTYLIENSEIYLGKKRLGKMAIRLLIGMKHLHSDDIDSVIDSILSLNLFPADRAEIERRKFIISRKSQKKNPKISKIEYVWPCGSVVERFMEIPGAGKRDFNWVEAAAIEEYARLDLYEEGTHCEGRIMMEVFKTVFEKYLFAIDQCESPLQYWAFDVGEQGRWSEVETRLQEIQLYDFSELSEWYSSQGGNTDSIIPRILDCLTGNVLAGIMRIIASEPYYWGGGQPDLILWSPSRKKVLFSEVKGPGDTLSPRQRWWLTELVQMGAGAEVCYITEPKKNSPEVTNAINSE